MTHPPNPGQIAYEAYWRISAPRVSAAVTARIWYALSSRTHEAWEAAAQAVLAMHQPQEDDA
jgi:hypothetical protein